MKQIWSFIQICFAALGGFLGWFLDGMDGFLYVLLTFVSIDYITGVMCAIADKNLSSEVGFKGICRKVMVFALVGIGNILDVYVLGDGSVLRTAVIFFYLSNEAFLSFEFEGNPSDWRTLKCTRLTGSRNKPSLIITVGNLSSKPCSMRGLFLCVNTTK